MESRLENENEEKLKCPWCGKEIEEKSEVKEFSIKCSHCGALI